MALEKRRGLAEIVSRNAEKVDYLAGVEPTFPEVRDLFGGVRMFASFSHPAPDPIARELWGQIVLLETAKEAGLLRDGVRVSGHAVSSKYAENLAYDYGVPAHWSNRHDPGYNRIGMGNFPEILKPYIPFFLQSLRKTLDLDTLATVTAKSFGRDEEAARRAQEVVKIFEPLTPISKKGKTEALPGLLAARSRAFDLMGIDHIEERAASGLMKTVAKALELLEKKGLPFYLMPLTDEFKAGGYLRAIDSEKIRKKVVITMDGSQPVYTFEDTVFKTPDGTVLKKTTEVRGDEIYGLIESGVVIPTVPTFLLAVMVGPQIPQMGGRDWRAYAPHLIDTTVQWIKESGKHGYDADLGRALFLCTEGYDPFKVIYRGKDGQHLSRHFSMGYVTMGGDEISNSLVSDTTIVGKYGVVGVSLRH